MENNPLRAEAERRLKVEQAQPNYIAGVARQAGQGVSFGFADEIEAGIRSLGSEQDYQDIRDEIREGNDAFAEVNPGVSLAANVAGGFAIPGLGAAKAISGGATAAAKIARGAGVGATEGAVFGAGVADEISDIPGEAATGAVIGGIAGAAAPVVIRAGQNVADTFKAVRDPSNSAERRLAAAIDRDGVPQEELQRRIQAGMDSGRPVTLADVAGENVRRELDRVIQTSPGPGAQNAARFLEDRNKAQIDRVSRSLVQFSGTAGDDVGEVISSRIRQRQEKSAPLYEQSFQFKAENSQEIVDAFDAAVSTPLGRKALNKAKVLLNAPDFDQAPLMQRVDALQKGYSDIIGTAKRSGEKELTRAGTIGRKGLVDVVDEFNPAYAEARATFSTETGFLDAIEEGRKVLSNNVTAADLKRSFAELDDANREAFRIGAVDAITTKFRQNSAKEPNLIKTLRSPEIKDKVAFLLPEDKAFQFRELIDAEDAMFELGRSARGGSQTAQRNALREEAASELGALQTVGIVGDLLTGGFKSLLFRGATWLPRRVRETLMAQQDEKLAQRLIGQDASISPQQIQRTSDQSENVSRRGGRAIGGSQAAIASAGESQSSINFSSRVNRAQQMVDDDVLNALRFINQGVNV